MKIYMGLQSYPGLRGNFAQPGELCTEKVKEAPCSMTITLDCSKKRFNLIYASLQGRICEKKLVVTANIRLICAKNAEPHFA